MYDFYKNFIFLSKNLFFLIKLFIQNEYLYPLSKNLILLKKNSLCKKIHSVKQIGKFFLEYIPICHQILTAFNFNNSRPVFAML